VIIAVITLIVVENVLKAVVSVAGAAIAIIKVFK
jgi:hypothetical protein